MEAYTTLKEQYIQVLRIMNEEPETISATDIAQSLELSAEDAYTLIDELADMGFIEQDDGQITFTYMGNDLSGQIIRNYETLQNYLMKTTGIDEKTATMVACALEDAVNFNQVESLYATIA